MMANHREDHPEDVPNCFGCKILSLTFNLGTFKATSN